MKINRIYVEKYLSLVDHICLEPRLVSPKHEHCNYFLEQNPYNLKADPCGSSSGSAISAAANMAAVTVGTETDGSILCPSSWNAIVGIKPTVGLTSRGGVIPITPRQDTVG